MFSDFITICSSDSCIFQHQSLTERNNETVSGGSVFSQSRHHVTIRKQVSEVCLHMGRKFPHDSEPLIQSSCFVSWCHNRVRKYFVSFLQNVAVRTSPRYDLISWSSRPLWWNAVIQDIREAKGSWTLPTLANTHTVCSHAFGWLVVWKGVNELAF